MRLWQACWRAGNRISSGELLIWAENPKGSSAFESSVEESDGIPKHPFACRSEQLEEDLDALEFDADEACEVELYLPSTTTIPLSSPKLFESQEELANENIELAIWRVPALKLDPLGAVSFLTSIPKELPKGLHFDDSFKFWIEATKLSLELLTRGRFIPGLIRENSGFVSHWYTIPTEANDHERISTLANGMPPVCRALVPKTEHENNEPSVILESFLSASTNSLNRLFLRRVEFSADIDTYKQTPKLIVQVNWLKSLTSSEVEIEGSDYELSALEQRLKSWGGNLLAIAKKQELRACFRLVPPELDAEDSSWIVEILLQSPNEFNRTISAHEIWQGELGFLKNSEYSPEDIEELLLEELGKASAIFEKLNEPLKQTYPTHFSLSNDDAHDFLRNTSKVLEQKGFGVMLPDWWNPQSSGVGLHLTVDSDDLMSNTRSTREEFVGMNQLVKFNWEISIGDKKFTVDEFKKLTADNSSLIKIDGKWIELQQSKISKTLKFLEEQEQRSKITLLEALRLGLGIESGQSALPIVGFSYSGWIKKLIESDDFSLSLVDPPKQFNGELRNYQQEGLSWLSFLAQAGIGGCLADDMGLGKTIQLIAFLQHEREQNPKEEHKPTLLVVPMSILDNWKKEAEKFAPSIRAYLHHGTARLSGKAFEEEVYNSDLVITTYSLAHRDEQLLSNIIWGRITLDEAQNIKNLATKQTQAIRRITFKQFEINTSGTACQRIALTGTPLENHLEELWSIFDFLNPGFLGNLNDFRRRFAIPIERYRSKDSSSALARSVKPFILRRLKTDPEVIQDLPDKIEMEVTTALTEEQARLYQEVLDDMIPQVDSVDGIHRKGLVLSTITKLKQICDHPTLYLKDESALSDRSGKLDRLEQLLEVILAEGDKVLIFTQYAQMGHLLKPYLQDKFNREALFLHGAMSRNARNKVIDRFQEKDGPSVFILSLKAGGFGLNLTEANQVIHFDQWWNPAVEEQATDRAYRIGQKRNVQVRKFICKGTLEEKIAEMLKAKKQLAEEVVGSTKNFITQLSTDELVNLLKLQAN